MALGLVRTHGGELTAGREHIDRAVEMCDAGHDRAVTASVAESPAVLNRVYAAWNWSLTSDGDEAVTALTEALAEAGKEGGQSYAMTYAVTFAAVVHTLRREVDEVRHYAEEGLKLAQAHGYGYLTPFLRACHGWAVAIDGEVDAGVAEVTAAAAALEAHGARFWGHALPGLSADALLAAGRAHEAVAAADAGLEQVALTGERWFEAELHRLRGLARLELDPASSSGREDLASAVSIARQQGARAFERRAMAAISAHGDR